MTEPLQPNVAAERPAFPKRAVVTGGMPYGNKSLHFGHVGGVFVHADIFARFLRDRIGAENVIFVSGTDCYGSPIVEAHRIAVEEGVFEGSLEQFVQANHETQKRDLAAYGVELSLFAASALSPYRERHEAVGRWLLESLHRHGHLCKLTTLQFYDPEREAFLNGRQVIGRCPIEGCGSDKAYADECSLGHQYEPKALIDPRSALTGETPEMREVSNWYVDVPALAPQLREWLDRVRAEQPWRPFSISSLCEHFEPPTVHITRDQVEAVDAVAAELPSHERVPGRRKSLRLVFGSVPDQEEAVSKLGAAGIRYRTGKTLVPFRMTGNLDWGLEAPVLEGLEDVTFWVWPESLWAPISFVSAYLDAQGAEPDAWRDWWCSEEAGVYQFIGEDNVFFYGLAQGAMFLGTQGETPSADVPDGHLRMTELVANRHLMFLDKKGSSSGKVKPPMADELLTLYTPEQLRTHFFSMALGRRPTSFRPKPFNPKAGEREKDPAVKEGNLFCNALNRAARSCFYTAQQYTDGRIPVAAISEDILAMANGAILEFEKAMAAREFSQAYVVIQDLVKGMNKHWAGAKPYAEDCDPDLRRQTLADAFHLLRTAVLLSHPIAPWGTELVREYLQLPESLWSWDHVFETVYEFMDDPETHRLKEVPPRFDFFPKHPSQYE